MNSALLLDSASIDHDSSHGGLLNIKENEYMAYCRHCGKEVNAEEVFCRHCGAKLVFPDADISHALSSFSASEKDFAAFIGKNSDKYLNKFRRFTQSGEDAFAVTWHWPAFVVPFFWMLYRKLYGWMILAFFLGLIPYVGVVCHIVFGMSAYYLYFRHAKVKLLGLKTRLSSEAGYTADMARAGGVNKGALVLAVVLTTIALIGIIVAIAIPRFAAYRQRAFDIKAKHEVQDACNRCTALFSAHPEKSEIVPDDLLNAGFSPSPDIDMMLLDGRRETFGLSARHEKSHKVFVVDRNCGISEELQKVL